MAAKAKTMKKVTRKYSMTKIRAGDWLLPSNDGKVFWRIQQYEDGPSFGILDWNRDKVFWSIWRWRGTTDQLTEALALDEIDLEPDLWDYLEGNYDKREDAIDAALRKKTT